MAVPALFSECNEPFWVEVASELRKRCGWEPVYWVGVDSMEAFVRQSFPGVTYHSKLAAMRGQPASDRTGAPPSALDQAILEEMAVCEGMVMRMLDRVDPGDYFPYRERLEIYYRYLGYWLAVIDDYRPQVVFFPMAPHMAYDYVLYALCQKRGIPTVMLEQVLINSMLLPIFRFEDQENQLTANYQRLLEQDQGGEVAISPAARAHVQSLTGQYKAPFYVKREKDTSGGHGGLGARAWLQMKSLPRHVLNPLQRGWEILSTPAPANYVKARGRRYHDGAPVSHAQFEYYRWLGRCKKARLKRLYDSLARPPRLDEPFVYLPLHYQPEMSSLPSGGYFEDQVVLAGLLSSCLPPGWSLYVKEHPVQVAPFGKGHQSREEHFYSRLLELSNVSLVPLTQPSFDLIDNCRAVATISGQAAWEAVNRGVPALTFGDCWYRGCEGVFHTTTQEACRKALAKIAGGYRPDLRKVQLFVKAAEETAVLGYVTPMFGTQYNIAHDENIQAISRAVTDLWLGRHGQPQPKTTPSCEIVY